MPRTGKGYSTSRFARSSQQYRDDGRAPAIQFERVRLLVWLDAPEAESQKALECVGRGALDVRLNNQTLTMALTSVKDIRQQVKRLMKCSDTEAERTAKAIPVQWSLHSPDDGHRALAALPSLGQVHRLLTQSVPTSNERELQSILHWQLCEIKVTEGSVDVKAETVPTSENSLSKIKRLNCPLTP